MSEYPCYILSMSCVSNDEVQVRIRLREDIIGWVKKLDHEGSSWTVTEMLQPDVAYDLTEDIQKECGA